MHQLFLLLALLPSFAWAELPSPLKTALQANQLPPSAYTILLERVDGSERRLDENTTQAMNPASVMKLVTSFAALDLLGQGFTWRSELRADQSPVKNILQGNLYLKGNGDPKLTQENLWLLLRQLRLRGVREIRGNLLADRSAFALPPHDPANFDGEGLRPYNAGADALLVNYAVQRFILFPAPDKKHVIVVQESAEKPLPLNNQLRVASGECTDWREGIKVVLQTNGLTLTGQYPLSCGEKKLGLNLLSPDQQLDSLFRSLWKELGGTWHGILQNSPSPKESLLLAELDSPPLASVLRDVNKFSNNVMARQVFLSLSAEAPATYEKAAHRVHESLQRHGIIAPELRIENGAGLSRQDRISADTLASVLRAAWRSPFMPEFIASLPVWGEDGTVKKRGNSHSRGRAHLKTGYIEGVRALAGYLHNPQGERWIFIVLINHPNAQQSKAALDTLLEWSLESINAPMVINPIAPIKHQPAASRPRPSQ